MTVASPNRGAAPPPEDVPGPGTRVDDFTVAYRISRGMSADVFAVWHHGLLAPLVCKRLRPADAGDEKSRRLLRAECDALRRLCHPCVVRLVGENMHAPLPYLLLEHAGTHTLRAELRESGAFEAARAVRLVQHLGGAVGHVHARGLLHRDLKPSNVVLRGGRPVLIDFGVAWDLGDVRRCPPDRSGTPQYLAPEQVTRMPLSPATDVYGLGALLFELLAGERPFRAGVEDWRAPLSARYPQLVDEPDFEALSARGVPEGLTSVIRKSLSRNPRARFQSVPELLRALDEFTPVKVYPEHLTPEAALLA
ncbi:MAG: serine/threonine protein kinase [Acidobacteria bacterium]|nr:serine/threonine protein kinase [Acidobacteriota bacterium]